MRFFTFVLIMFWAFAGLAQSAGTYGADTTSLNVNIKQDAQIERLLRAHKEAMSRDRGISGFRVQIYSDSGNQSKLRTQRRKAEFDNKFPGVQSYIVYDAPDFKLRVGDFRTRLDARRFLEKIARDYQAAYIVVDNINYPGFD